MMKLPASFLIGLLFGLGLVTSGMTNPAKIVGFLDVAGAWDPSLACVMGGALATTYLGFRFALPRSKPLLADAYPGQPKAQIDARLVLGAAIFGMGWGLAGLCPGPAVAAAFSGITDVWIFLGAMIAGIYLNLGLGRRLG